MANLYDKNSIESLEPREFVRLKPGVYAGDTTYSTQLLVEALANAIDEHKAGHCTNIHVHIYSDGSVIFEDNGQGFLPNEMREDGKSVMEAAFSVLNTSGKYHEDGVYEGTSLGAFGIGSKLITFLSHITKVFTVRDNKYEQITFKEGIFKTRESGEVGEFSPYRDKSGTRVHWTPSEEFFTYPEVEIEKVKNLFHTISCLCPGLTIELEYNNEPVIIYTSKNGLNDLVDEAVAAKEIIKNRFSLSFSKGKSKLDLVMTYTSAYTSTIVPYVNTGLTDSGVHITQLKTLITKEFNQFFRKKEWLKEKDENLSGDDIQEGMYLVFNLTSVNVGYDSQVKSRIVKIDIRIQYRAFVNGLREWLEHNEKDAKVIAEKAINARKARTAAKKAREAVRNVTPAKSKGLKAKMELSDKFVDCKSKDPKKRCLHLVEGLSAAGSVIEARNTEIDCVYMLRGKIISPLKQPLEKILANQEMSDIIRVIGAGFGDKFDVSKMNFDKIIITSDQDSDGTYRAC